MRQLQMVIDADKRHQRAMRSALSEQAAKLGEQHAEALKQAEQGAAAAQAQLKHQLQQVQQRADASEQTASEAQRRVAEAEEAAAAAQRRATAAEEAVHHTTNPDGDGGNVQQRLAQTEQQLAEAQQRMREVEQQRMQEGQAPDLQLQLEGTQDQLAETQQRLREAEQRHAAEAAALQSQLAAAREQHQQASGDVSRPAAGGRDAADEAAVAAAVQRRQNALGSEFEQALQRQEQQLRAQHAAEIASLEQVPHWQTLPFLIDKDGEQEFTGNTVLPHADALSGTLSKF